MILSLLAGIVTGLVRKPFYLNFINGVSYASIVWLLIGLIRWGWIRGDFAYFSWKPDKGSYNRYRKDLQDSRTGKDNAVLAAGVITLVIAMVLTVLY